MKILRFNDDRIGALKDSDCRVDVSSVISPRVEKGPKRAIEEVIENFDDLRGKFHEILNKESGLPLNGVKLLARPAAARHPQRKRSA